MLHHLGRDHLTGFLQQTARSRVATLAHVDVNPGPWADVGACVLHRTRMREPMSRHGGSMSMQRALTADTLLQHAGTAGIRASRGRDGRTRHRAIEIRGAVRGTVAPVALLTPVAIVTWDWRAALVGAFATTMGPLAHPTARRWW